MQQTEDIVARALYYARRAKKLRKGYHHMVECPHRQPTRGIDARYCTKCNPSIHPEYDEADPIVVKKMEERAHDMLNWLKEQGVDTGCLLK